MISHGAAPNKEEFIETRSGRRRRVRSWLPPQDARASLTVVHEFRSSGVGYQRFAEAMVRHGIVVHAVGLPVHGASRFRDHVDDIGALMSLSRAREPALPAFLLGQGAAAVAASLYVLTHQRNIAGLICESIALEMPISAAKQAIVRISAALVPGLQGRSFGGRMRAAAELRTRMANLTVPLLVMHGSHDTIALPIGSEQLHAGAGSSDKTLQIFEGYYHHLIDGAGHEHVFERVRQWIEERLQAGHAGRIGIAYINTEL